MNAIFVTNNSSRLRSIYLFVVLISSSLLTIAKAQQLCDGNLGQNIFTKGDFGNGLDNNLLVDPQIAPGYQYESSPPPHDGFYTITNSTAQWSNIFGTWIKIGDNSNDPRGYMMVVNASNEPGLFYEEQVTDLCENTVYEFSADIINLVRTGVEGHIFPNVSFLINDLEQFSSGDILQTQKWQKYGFTFKTDPGQTEVKLSLRNNAPGGSGNDLAIDNISFQACGSSAFLNAAETLFLCENDNTPVKLEADIEADNQAILWQTSTDSLTWIDLPTITEEFLFHDDFNVGTYYYRYFTAGTETELLNIKCRIISDVLLVEVLPLDYQVLDTICPNQVYVFGDQELSMTGDYFNAFTSSRGCDSLVDLSLTVLEEEAYQLVIDLTNPSCFKDTDGSITGVIENGQLAPYQFSLNELESDDISFSDLAADSYTLVIQDNLGCTQSFEYALNEPEELVINLPTDTSISLGQILDIELNSNQDLQTVNWQPASFGFCENCFEINYQPGFSHSLIAEVSSDKNCVAHDTMNVEVINSDLEIYFPNVISSSDLSTNNAFTIGATNGLIKELKQISIYDRWGNIIHEQANTTELTLWKNPTVEQGVYTYLVELLLLDDKVYTYYGQILHLN